MSQPTLVKRSGWGNTYHRAWVKRLPSGEPVGLWVDDRMVWWVNAPAYPPGSRWMLEALGWKGEEHYA